MRKRDLLQAAIMAFALIPTLTHAQDNTANVLEGLNNFRFGLSVNEIKSVAPPEFYIHDNGVEGKMTISGRNYNVVISFANVNPMDYSSGNMNEVRLSDLDYGPPCHDRDQIVVKNLTAKYGEFQPLEKMAVLSKEDRETIEADRSNQMSEPNRNIGYRLRRQFSNNAHIDIAVKMYSGGSDHSCDIVITYSKDGLQVPVPGPALPQGTF